MPPLSAGPLHGASIGEFADRHGTSLLRVAMGICRDRSAAEDLVQDALVRLLPRWEQVQRARQPLAYVRTVMVRLYLDESARGPDTFPVGDHQDVESGGQVDSFAELESVDAAVSMLSCLAPRARAVLTLRYIEDLSDREIARTLGVSRSTVRVTAHQALRKLSVSEARTGRRAGRKTS